MRETCHAHLIFPDFITLVLFGDRSQWPRGLRSVSTVARLLRLWVQIPPEAWLFASCECCVLSGRGIVRLKCDGTRAETRFSLSPKRTSPFKSAGASVQSNTGSRGVCISVSNAGYTTFRGSVRALATHSIRQFPLHFPSRASPCAIRFQTHSTCVWPFARPEEFYQEWCV